MAENSPLEVAVTNHINSSDMPSWERMQYKAFRSWVNHKLSARPWPAVGLLETCFEDGLTLAALLEILSGKQVAPPGAIQKNAKIRIQKLSNLDYSFRFMEKEGIRLENIGGEDIVDNNRKLILGLIWTLILHYQIAMYNESTPRVGGSPRPGKQPAGKSAGPRTPAKDALLKRVQDRVAPLNVPVKDFDKSFQDGIAFCALIHAHNPNLIPFNSLKPENKKENLNLAFNTMRDKFGLPPMLDADDIIDTKPDEKAVMAYVGSMLPLLQDKPALPPASAPREAVEEPASAPAPAPAAAPPPPPPPRASARESTLNSTPPAGSDNTLQLPSPVRNVPNFQVVAKEDNGNPIRRGGAQFESWISGGPTPINVRIVDLQNGLYDLVLTPSLTSAAPGRYELHVTLDRADIKGSPLYIVIEQPQMPVSAKHSQLTSAPAAQADSNTLSLNLPLKNDPAFRVQTRDANGAPQQLGNGKLDAWITGPSSLTARVDDVPSSGATELSVSIWPPLTSALPGRYELSVTLAGEHLRGSPLVLLLREPDVPKISARNCQLLSEPRAAEPNNTLELATPLQGPAPKFTVQGRDDSNAPMRSGGAAFRAWVNGPPNTYLTARVDDNGSGTYAIVVSPPIASSAPGRYELHVQLNDTEIGGSPLVIIVKEPIILPSTPSRRSIANTPASPAALSELDKLLDNLSGKQQQDTPPAPPPRARASPLHSVVTSRPPAEPSSGVLRVQLPVPVTPVFSLQTKDDENKFMIRGGDNVTAYITGPQGHQPVTVNDKGVGSYDLLLPEPLLKPGRYELHVQLNGTPLRSNPFVIDVADAPVVVVPVARQSSATALSTPPPAATRSVPTLPTASECDVIIINLSALPPLRALDDPAVAKALQPSARPSAADLRAVLTDLDAAPYTAAKQPWNDGAAEREILDGMQPITADLIAEVTEAPEKRSYDLSRVLAAVIRMLQLARRTILLIDDRVDVENIVAGSRSLVIAFLRFVVAFDMLRYRADRESQVLLVSAAQRLLNDYEALRQLLINALLKQRRAVAARAVVSTPPMPRSSSYGVTSAPAPQNRITVTIVSLPRMDGAATLVVESLPQNQAQFIAYNFIPLDELCTAIASVVRELHPQLNSADQRRLAEAVQLVLADAKQMRALQSARNYNSYAQLQPSFVAHVRALVALVVSLAAALGSATPQPPTTVTVTVRSVAPPAAAPAPTQTPLPALLPPTYTLTLDVRALKRVLDETIAEIIQASKEVTDPADRKLLSSLAIDLSGADLPVVQAMDSQDNQLVVQEHQRFVTRLRSAAATLDEVSRRERAREDAKRLRCAACRAEISGAYMQCANGNFHNACFCCATCRQQLNSQYYHVGGLFYCPSHPPQ